MFDSEAQHIQRLAESILQSDQQGSLLFFQGVTRQVWELNHGCFNNNDGRQGNGQLLIAIPTSTQVRLQSTLRGLRVGIRCSKLSRMTLHYSNEWRFNQDLQDVFTADVPGLFLSLDPRDYPNEALRDEEEFLLVTEKDPGALPMVLGSTWPLIQSLLDDPEMFASTISHTD